MRDKAESAGRTIADCSLFYRGLELDLTFQDFRAFNSILSIDDHWFTKGTNEAETCIAHGGARLSAYGNA
jgi:hypothetical protein